MGGLPTGGRVGRRKSQHVSRQSLWSIVCNAPLLFSLQQQNQEENAKKKCQQNWAAKILSKQKTSAKEGGKKRLSAFHFSLRAIVK